jgi:uncharacterized protein (DUF58 family)
MGQEMIDRMGSAMHYDFCPWANKYVYWLKRPIGWVVLAFLASLLLGIYVSHQAYMAAGIIAAVGVIGAAWPWISMIGIRGELSWNPSRCEEGDTIDTTLTIANRWPWPAWGLVVQADDAISEQIDAPEQPISLSKVPAWTRSRFRWLCQPKARGVYPKRQVRLTTAFPFGIWSCSRMLHVSEPLIVWPRSVRLTDVPENSGTQHLGIGGVSQRVGDDGDWMGVRPYREGDSLRQVHWAQTARRDMLVVFERQTRSRQTASIAMDTLAAANCSSAESDWMLRILVSLANHLMHHSWNVRVHMGGRWQVWHSGNRDRLMDEIAAWDPHASHKVSEPNFERDSGYSIAISTATPGIATTRVHQGVCVFRTQAGGIMPPDIGDDSHTAWTICIEDHPEDALREAWRQLCQWGVASEAIGRS